MKILIDVGHPADFLLFRQFALQMQNKGNELIFTAREKDVLLELIFDAGFEVKSFGRNFKNLIWKLWGIVKFDFRLYIVSLRFKPDIYLSAGSVYASHISFVRRKPHIVFEDTGNFEQIKLYRPFASVILTSASFKKDLGKKQLYYSGYHELAYLRPNYFTPDISKVDTHIDLNLKPLVILRFVSWSASHDIGLKGFSLSEKIDIVHELSKNSNVYISSETKLPEEIEAFHLPVEARYLHHVLAFASLVIGEGATVAAEAAVLGTPAIYINPQPLGYLDEMEIYGLVNNFRQFTPEVLNKAKEILRTDRNLFINAGKRLISEKIDVTAFMVWFVENYPSSAAIMREDPSYPNRFR